MLQLATNLQPLTVVALHFVLQVFDYTLDVFDNVRRMQTNGRCPPNYTKPTFKQYENRG